MKEIFLSLKPEAFKLILYGIKKYEYRKRFCDEPVRAYLYISGKSKQVVGIVDLARPIRLDKTKEDYVDHPETLKRVEKYILARNVNAIPILSLTLFKEPLHLNEIRQTLPKFMPPQMYYLLENNPALKKIVENQPLGKRVFTRKHEKIDYENLAMSSTDLKKLEAFKKLNTLHTKNKDYDKIIM